jgi:serine/threonine protein kinase
MDEEQFHVLTTTCGTPGYMAPEIFKKSGHGKPVYVYFPSITTTPPPYQWKKRCMANCNDLCLAKSIVISGP